MIFFLSMLVGWVVFLAGLYIYDIFRSNMIDEDGE